MSMTNEQREAIEDFKREYEQCNYTQSDLIIELDYAKEILSLIKEQQEREELIKEYVHQEIVHYTETIEDYEDDDKEGNKHYIEELKAKREHWRDVEKLLQSKPKEELYMNWWKYGLYE